MNSIRTGQYSYKRAIVAGVAGNMMEWYDFAIYGYMVPVIGGLFFPSDNPFASRRKGVEALFKKSERWAGEQIRSRAESMRYNTMSYIIHLVIPMTVSVRLPEPTKRQLIAYCQAHRVSKSEAVRKALELLLAAETHQPTAYELGAGGFGADKTHTGDIARQSKKLLRENFRGRADR